MDPETGVPAAILDATAITEVRTGAVTAIGAEHLARPGARSLGPHRRPRHLLLERAAAVPGAARPATRSGCTRAGAESREAFARRLSGRPGPRGASPSTAGRSACGAPTSWSRPARLTEPDAAAADRVDLAGRAGRFPTGRSARSSSICWTIMDKVVVDDWGQAGIGPLGALRPHVDTGRLTEATLHAELGQIVAGRARAASTAARRSCSGTAACRSPTSHWARRCSRRRGASGSARSSPTASASRRAAHRSAYRNHPRQSAGLQQHQNRHQQDQHQAPADHLAEDVALLAGHADGGGTDR